MKIFRALLLPLLAFISVFFTVLYVFDLQKTMNHASTCEMTYSWPVYTPLKWISHPKYTLYSLHQKQKRTKLTGTPLLFLPGHLGSYRQARSIAVHLYELDENRFDVFTIDFNEELTALSGNFVMDQAIFVNDAIRMILKK
jgi:glycosylphosphatidylinositol deacylase